MIIELGKAYGSGKLRNGSDKVVSTLGNVKSVELVDDSRSFTAGRVDSELRFGGLLTFENVLTFRESVELFPRSNTVDEKDKTGSVSTPES